MYDPLDAFDDPTTVLTDGDYVIKWRGGRTFNIYLLGREVNVFSIMDPVATQRQAVDLAHDWWVNDGGKELTQEVVRESAW